MGGGMPAVAVILEENGNSGASKSGGGGGAVNSTIGAMADPPETLGKAVGICPSAAPLWIGTPLGKTAAALALGASGVEDAPACTPSSACSSRTDGGAAAPAALAMRGTLRPSLPAPENNARLPP